MKRKIILSALGVLFILALLAHRQKSQSCAKTQPQVELKEKSELRLPTLWFNLPLNKPEKGQLFIKG